MYKMCMKDYVNMTDSGNYFPAFTLLTNPQNAIFPHAGPNSRNYCSFAISSKNVFK